MIGVIRNVANSTYKVILTHRGGCVITPLSRFSLPQLGHQVNSKPVLFSNCSRSLWAWLKSSCETEILLVCHTPVVPKKNLNCFGLLLKCSGCRFCQEFRLSAGLLWFRIRLKVCMTWLRVIIWIFLVIRIRFFSGGLRIICRHFWRPRHTNIQLVFCPW